MNCFLHAGIGAAFAGFFLCLTGCGAGSNSSPPPIILSVALGNTTIVLPPNGIPIYVPVTIVAPTETASLTVNGLPAGVAETYQPSESNPSGLLTIVANSTAPPGTYMPTIVVGSSGQTASLVFTLTVSGENKTP